MEFHSKRDYLNLSVVTFMAIITIFNPTSVSALKILCILAFITVFYFAMTIHTAIIKKDSIQYSIKFFSFTISQRSIPIESIEKIEKIKSTIKLYCKDGKSIHFLIYSPEFIAAMEEFCTQHNIAIVAKETTTKNA